MRKAYPLLALALLGAYTLALFLNSLLGRGAMFFQDVSLDSIPLRTAAAQAVRAGHLPLWEGRIGHGFSVMGESQAGVFYPLNILHYVGLPQYWAFAVEAALHCLLAALFAMLYCRLWGPGWAASATAGFIYGLSGFFICHLQVIAMVQAAAWLPLTLLCLEMWLRSADRRWLAGAALSLAMPGLSSYPQMLMFSLMTVALYMLVAALGRTPEGGVGRGLWRVTVIGALVAVEAGALLLSAVQLLPTTALIHESARAEMTPEQLRELCLTPRSLAYFIHPYVFGSYADDTYFGGEHHYEVCGYVGTVALLFGLVGALHGRGRARAFCVVLVPLALFMGLARQNPLYEILPGVPGLGAFRSAGRYVLLSSFGLGVLTALGLHAVTQSRSAARMTAVLGVLGVLLALAIPVGLRATESQLVAKLKSLVPEQRTAPHDAERKARDKYRFILERLGPRDALYVTLILALAVPAGLCARGSGRRVGASGVPGVALGLTVAQLFLFARDYNPTISPDYYRTQPRVLRHLDASCGEALLNDDDHGIASALGGARGWAHGDLSGVWRVWEVVRPNRQVVHGARGVAIAYPLATQRNRDLLRVLGATLRGTADPETELRIAQPGQVLSALGARVVVSLSRGVLNRLPVVEDFGGGVRAYRVPEVAPLAYFASGIVACQGQEQALRLMCSQGFRWRVPVVEMGAEAPPQVTAGKARVLSYHDDYGHLRIRCRAVAPSLLVVREAYDAHFRCLVDGRPVPIRRANYLFRAIPLGPGEHEVEMAHSGKEVKLGGTVSLLALVAVIGALTRRPRRN